MARKSLLEQSQVNDLKGRKAIEKVAHHLERLAVEYVPIDSISPNTYNPNRQSDRDFELLCRSMQEDGFTQPVLVQSDTREIVDGEHRWRAAKVLGQTEIPVVFVDMTPEQMRVSTLRHNRARGSEDLELTAALLRDLRELGALDYAQDSLMLDPKELEALIDDIPAPEALARDEFSTAWVPTGFKVSDDTTGGATEHEGSRGISLESSTPEAAMREQVAQQRLSETTDAEERAHILQQRQIFRLSLTFTGEEANVIRAVLGDTPASKLLELCKLEEQEGAAV